MKNILVGARNKHGLLALVSPFEGKLIDAEGVDVPSNTIARDNKQISEKLTYCSSTPNSIRKIR